ncbi:Sprouty-related, EVH1 domain-containing protein 2 [Heterocephalus glaber]|uniref:Sprouty-related, EVH1 domain-containing protein 2 n=1 Tax=Heterocephalus glaber TaxID=10181 RepID=G5ARK9_HETGA|nr:Sprouty-related, EVH1 domain-containing protein 2 [Heterocephalus glaber]
MFNLEENWRGHCQDTPDSVRTCVYHVSCTCRVDSMLNHLLSDPEGNYTDPCSCDTSDENFCLCWMALNALSFLAPCVCCYLPLRACYHCGVMCSSKGSAMQATDFWWVLSLLFPKALKSVFRVVPVDGQHQVPTE